MSRTVRFLLSATLLVGASLAEAGMLEKGEMFPQWELSDHTGKRVKSADLAGKSYLLWFYPAALTPGCAMEGRGLRDNFARFQELGVEIIGVSFDPPEANARFVAAEGFPFRLLSDTGGTLAVAVGAADSPNQVYARRVSYLVGGDAKILEVYPTVRPASHAQSVLGDLKQRPPPI